MKRLFALLILPLVAIAAVAPIYSVALYKGTSKVTDIIGSSQQAAWNNCIAQATLPTHSCKTPVIKFATVSSSSSSASSSSSSVSSSSSSASSASSSSSAIACAKLPTSYTTTGVWDVKLYGRYVVGNNNWNGLTGQELWANSEGCWGVITNAATVSGSFIRSYPVVTRGWTNSQTAMQLASTPGTYDMTTKAGLGIPVSQLTKAKVKWSYDAPWTQTWIGGPPRWMALHDIYFHKTPNPGPNEFPPFIDLMINTALADQLFGDGVTTFYGYVAKAANASDVTIAGVTYLVYIDESGENGFHQAGGHTIHLFQKPTTGVSWGVKSAVTDVAAIVKYFMQASPKNDAGAVLKLANGSLVTSPLITPDLYLTAVNAGFEINVGTAFTTTAFCVAMQGEPDCP